MSFLPPDPARVAEWIKVFESLEAVGRFPPSTPEGRRRRAIQTIRAEDRIKRLRAEARVVAHLSDDDLIAPQCPGIPIRVSSFDL